MYIVLYKHDTKFPLFAGLVMWEVVYRIQTTPSISPAYQPPYWDLVNLDPSLDEMRKVVCLDLMRPDTPPEWEAREPHASLARLMAECWYPDPAARLTALRIKKSCQKIHGAPGQVPGVKPAHYPSSSLQMEQI